MNKRDWYFRQPLKENEFDAAFDDIESAMFNIVKDLGLYGLISGGAVAGVSPLVVSVAAFLGYDKQGRRLSSGAFSGMDITNDSLGNPNMPSSGHFRVVTLVARHGYLPSDSRTDGNGSPIKFIQDEVISATGDNTLASAGLLQVLQGAEASSSGAAVPPVVGADDIVIADVIIDHTGAVIGGGVSYSRVTHIPSLVIVPWDSLSSYSVGQLVRGPDGEVYAATKDIAPGTGVSDIAWKVWRGSATLGTLAETIVAYLNPPRSRRVSGVDHFGYRAGRFFEFQENWLDLAPDAPITTGSGVLYGPWKYKFINPPGGEAITVNGPWVSDHTTHPRGAMLGIHTAGAGPASSVVVEMGKPLIYMEEASLLFETEFTLNGATPVYINTSFGLGFGEGTLFGLTGADAMDTGTAQIGGAYIAKLSGATTLTAITRPSGGGSGVETNTGVTPVRGTLFLYKVYVLGNVDSDNGARRVLHYLNGTLVGDHAVNMLNLKATPFFRMTANGGPEDCFLNVGPVRVAAALASDITF